MEHGAGKSEQDRGRKSGDGRFPVPVVGLRSVSPSRSIENLKSLRALLLVSLTNKSVHHDQEKRGQRQ